jgi:beta-lactamase superfamily II metal-dependent hydrolase
MSLTVHFLNVGHGDCTIIELPSGRLMMIDINNSKSLPDDDVVALAAAKGVSPWVFKAAGRAEGGQSWEEYYRSLLVDPFDYYQARFAGRSIFRYLQSHPDMDHMSGLHRFFWQERVPLENFWDVAHGKTFEKKDFESSPYSYLDWRVYTMLRNGLGPEDDNGKPTKHQVITNLRGDRGEYWTNDNITVLSPTEELIKGCDKRDNYNDCSYVLKISHGGRSIILPGDAEAAAWNSMLDAVGEDGLKCDLLKASHHGRKSGYHEKAVATMNPSIVVCSVGEKPDTDASADYARIAEHVLSTRFHGTIRATIEDNGRVKVFNYKGERIATLPALTR